MLCAAGSKFFLILEFLAGRSLEDVLLTDGPMAEPAAVGITMATLDGLSAVHAAKLVHRDMKPDNVILHSPAGSRRPIPKIVDFGMAKGVRSADGGAISRRRDCHFTDTPSSSTLKRLLKGEGGAAE